nr:retrotransposon Orf1 [Tanacetum cinerariifolium]
MGDANLMRTPGDYSQPSHEGYRNTIELPEGNNVVPLRSDTIRTVKLYNNIMMFQQHQRESLSKSWTRFKDLLQNAPCHGNDLWLQVPFLYDHVTPAISGPYDTQYCMENLEQAFVEYTSSRTDEARGKWYTFKPEQNNLGDIYNPSWKSHPNLRLSKFEADFKQQQSEMTNKIDTVLKAITDRMAGALPSDTVDDSHIEEPDVGENAGVGESKGEYCDIFLTSSELAYHNYLMCGPIPPIFLRNPIIIEGCLSNLKVSCNIGHVHVEKAYINLNSPLNVMTQMLYNWIMRRKLDPRENTNGGVNNFTGRIKGTHVFVGNFTYVIDFMIIEDISSIIDPRLSQVVLETPFVEISHMTHNAPEGVVRFTNGTYEIAYKMPHKIKQYNSLSDMEREHTKPVYLRNEEDKRRGVEYAMSKILGFYKECLELGLKYVTGIANKGEVM